jgi:SAM-dependent methyltransferase
MDVFSNPSFWEEYGSTPDYQERFVLISELLPEGSVNLLDVGCGDGRVISNLSKIRPDISLTGVDTFSNKGVLGKFSYCQARLPLLPFPDKSFDAVISLEVLEHIENIQIAIEEIQRLARDQIIIGVPYLENLQSLSTICDNCGNSSHAYGHLHSFSKNDMVDLLPDFTMQNCSLVGLKQRRTSRIGVYMEHHLAESFYHADQFVCPYCGSIQSAKKVKKPVIYPVVHGLNRIITLFSPKFPYWVIATYIRKS